MSLIFAMCITTYNTGLKFWKVGAQKIYSVKLAELKRMKQKYPADTSSSDSEPPRAKVAKLSPLVYSDIDKNVQSVKNMIESLFSIEKTLNIPIVANFSDPNRDRKPHPQTSHT